MKKILGLLGAIVMTGNAIPSVIAASPYQKQEKLNNNLNYLQTNNLEKLIRNKRQNDDEFEKSIYTNNIIGEVKEDTMLFFKKFKCFFIKLTPVFWREIINLYISTKNEDDFSARFENKIEN